MTFARPSTRAVAATLIAAAIGIIAPACSSSSDGAKPATTTAAEPTTTTAPTTTAAPTTTVPAAPVGLPDQEAVAQKLYDAWKANDKATAATVADAAAIDNMWRAAPGDYSLYNSCSTGEFDTSGCLFRGNPGTIQIDLEKRGDNWVVAGAVWSEP
ncbi:MAG: hypothetical protein ACTHN0_09895 [Aquihabitans sp.]